MPQVSSPGGSPSKRSDPYEFTGTDPNQSPLTNRYRSRKSKEKSRWKPKSDDARIGRAGPGRKYMKDVVSSSQRRARGSNSFGSLSIQSRPLVLDRDTESSNSMNNRHLGSKSKTTPAVRLRHDKRHISEASRKRSTQQKTMLELISAKSPISGFSKVSERSGTDSKDHPSSGAQVCSPKPSLSTGPTSGDIKQKHSLHQKSNAQQTNLSRNLSRSSLRHAGTPSRSARPLNSQPMQKTLKSINIGTHSIPIRSATMRFEYRMTRGAEEPSHIVVDHQQTDGTWAYVKINGKSIHQIHTCETAYVQPLILAIACSDGQYKTRGAANEYTPLTNSKRFKMDYVGTSSNGVLEEGSEWEDCRKWILLQFKAWPTSYSHDDVAKYYNKLKSLLRKVASRNEGGRFQTIKSSVEAKSIMDHFESAPVALDISMDEDDIAVIEERASKNSSVINSNDDSNAAILLFVYKAPGMKGGIPIHNTDLQKLRPGEYLNDLLIEFYFSYLKHQRLTEHEWRASLFLNTFFINALMGETSGFGKRSHEDGYEKGRKWLSKINLFQKQFVFVPINRDQHWFMVVICFVDRVPELMRRKRQEVLERQRREEERQKVKERLRNTGQTTMVIDSDEEEDAEPQIDDNQMMIDVENENQILQRTMEDQTGDIENFTCIDGTDACSICQIQESQPRSNPVILIFDSMQGSNISYRTITRALRTFVCRYANEQMGWEGQDYVKLVEEDFPVLDLRVPQQDNVCDCGVYLLEYSEMFFRKPILQWNHNPINIPNWFAISNVSEKRNDIKVLLSQMKRDPELMLQRRRLRRRPSVAVDPQSDVSESHIPAPPDGFSTSAPPSRNTCNEQRPESSVASSEAESETPATKRKPEGSMSPSKKRSAHTKHNSNGSQHHEEAKDKDKPDSEGTVKAVKDLIPNERMTRGMRKRGESMFSLH